MDFEIATWYDTWNAQGLANLQAGTVPLGYASRYNLAFGVFEPCANGYTLDLNGKYASQVMAQIRRQAPGVLIYAGAGDTGLVDTVKDNAAHHNRSTANIVAYLRDRRLDGIAIDAEGDGLSSVVQLVTQLGPSFRAAGLGIAVSVPWPGNGPAMYGDGAVQAFNEHVDAAELQDYSSGGTPSDVPAWTAAGVRASILMGGVCTENGAVQTSLSDTAAWTQFALLNGMRGMFSWRLDNDHGRDGEKEDVDPTFTGARTVYETARSAIQATATAG